MNEKLQKYFENKKYDLALQLINKIQKKEYTPEYHNYKIVVYLLTHKYDAALAESTELLSKFPNDPAFLCNMGLACKGKKKFDDAINYLNKSLRIDSENLNTYFNLIETYIQIFNFTEAIKLLKKILHKNIRNENCYQMLAYCYREINSFEESHNNLILSIKENPFNYENYYHLGFSFIWKKDFNNAIMSYKKCIELNKNYIPAIYQLNKLNEFSLNSIEHNMLESISDKELDKYNLSYKYLTLSDIYYNQKNYHKFFQYLHKANQLQNSLLNFKPYDQTKIKIQYNELDQFKFHNLDITPIFILGMPRSGSSVIEQVLSANEDVYAAGEIPLLHENFLINIQSNERGLDYNKLNSIRNSYITYLSALPKKKYIVDKLPLNFFWIGFIKIIFPNAIFIHTMRNKLDVCMSLYRTFFAQGVLEFSYSQKNIIDFYSLYQDMIIFWKSNHLNLIDVRYEDLLNNPPLIFDKLFKQLNLNFNESFLNLEKIARPVKTASFLQINRKLKKINSPDWTQYEKDISLFLK